MPIERKCLKCNGTGKIKTLFFDPPHWRDLPCEDCQGKGRVIETTWQEKKKAKESLEPDPDPTPQHRSPVRVPSVP